MIHLIFGSAATSSLKYALSEQSHKIIGFPIDFSVGPITHIHRNSGIHSYFSWLETSFHTMWNFFEEDQLAYCQALQQLSAINDGEQVTIWTCENASEQIGLRISCYLLKEKNVTLRYVNTYHAMRHSFKQKDVQIDIRHSGECNAEQLTYFYKHSTYPMTKNMKNDYATEGEKLLNCTSIVRSWQHGEIVDDRETRDDPFILGCAIKMHHEMPNVEFIHATRVIGEVVSNSEQAISDAWIEFRIRSLIDSKQLDFEGNLKAMRMYKIKVLQ